MLEQARTPVAGEGRRRRRAAGRGRLDFVGERIRSIRKSRRQTQAELAKSIGIIQSDLCRMEKGEYKVGLEILFRILRVFEMDISEFFSDMKFKEASGGDKDIFDAYNQLSERAKKEVRDFILFKAAHDQPVK